jgi:hypothetical protein
MVRISLCLVSLCWVSWRPSRANQSKDYFYAYLNVWLDKLACFKVENAQLNLHSTKPCQTKYVTPLFICMNIYGAWVNGLVYMRVCIYIYMCVCVCVCVRVCVWVDECVRVHVCNICKWVNFYFYSRFMGDFIYIYVGILCFESEVFNSLFSNFSFK